MSSSVTSMTSSVNDSSNNTRRRVKLYALNIDRQWDDRGTGHVSSQFVERLKGMALMVKAESDQSLLLESKILSDTAYQKQQETLIVWSEGDNYDLALSFQEKIGCDEIWAKICAVQGKDPSVDITQDINDDEDDRFDDRDGNGNDSQLNSNNNGNGSGSGIGSGNNSSLNASTFTIELPEPINNKRLDELSELITTCLPFPIKREKLALALETDNYIKKLLLVFRESERTCDRKALFKLHEIFKNIFLLNKNPLFEVMLSEESLWDVIGIFEYDPSNQTSMSQSSSQHKNHREYLRSVSKFKEVIPLGNRELISKIHQTYRVQYIQDVVLPTPSVFEENMLSTLSSFIFFNKVEIVSLIQEDEKFLKELFQQLSSKLTIIDKRRDLVLFLKEFSTFSQTLQPQNRENFFKTLSSLGILSTLEGILTIDDIVIKLASVDILTYVVEYSPSMVREYALQCEQTQDQDQYLVNIIIEQMICDSDPDLGMATQLSGIIKLLVDPENMLSASVVNKSEKTDFLNYFYKHCMHIMIGPIISIEENDYNIIRLINGQSAQLLSIIIELLSFCVEHHAYHIRNYILHKDLLRKILYLMQSSHTFLVLTSLRFMRKIVGLKDEFYNRHIISGNLMKPIIDSFNSNNGRYNLLDSAIIELFEFIRTEEIKSLCLYVMEKYWKQFESIDYVRTFKGLRLQYEQHQDRLKDKSLDSPSALLSRRFRREPRQMDSDEEMWFASQDDEECDDCEQNDSLNYKLDQQFDQQFNKKMLSHVQSSQQSQQQSKSMNIETKNKSIFDSLQQNDNKSEIKIQTQQQSQDISFTSSSNTTSTTTMTSRKGLVDYDIHPDEDSDEEEDGDSGDEDNVVVVDNECSSPKRQRLQQNNNNNNNNESRESQQ